MRQLDIDQLRTGAREQRGGTLDSALDLGRKPFGIHERTDHADAFASQALGPSTGGIRPRAAGVGERPIGAVARVAPACRKRVHGKRHIDHAAAERADLVQRRAKGHHAIPGNRPVAGLEADHTAQGRRLANRAARIGAQRQRGLACSNRGRRTARGTTRNALEIPRIGRVRKRRALGCRAECELVHIRLAHRHAARGEHTLYRSCRVR